MRDPFESRLCRSMKYGCVAAVATACLTFKFNLPAHAAEMPANLTPQQQMILALPVDVRILYIVGDLNGDGRVDAKDLNLLRAAVASKGSTPAGVTCMAAGDVNLDRVVDNKDVEVLSGWLRASPQIAIPALYWQPSVPCSPGEPFLGATIDPRPNSNVRVRFLEPVYSPSNVSLVVRSGPATFRPAMDGKGFDGHTLSRARPGQTVTTMVTLPDGRRYYLDFHIAPRRGTDASGAARP
jgi:hypothetical protein